MGQLALGAMRLRPTSCNRPSTACRIWLTIISTHGDQLVWAHANPEVKPVNEAHELLERDPVLQRSIRLRNPYVDPLSFLQVDALRRWREGGREDDQLLRVLVQTVRGIARGLRNTG